MIIVQYTVALE